MYGPQTLAACLVAPYGECRRVRARVVPGGDLAGDDPAVVHHAVDDPDPVRRPRRRHAHLLLARVDVADRPTRLHSGERGDRLGDDVDLAAEPAADGAADEVQPGRVDLQDDRRVVEREVERLRVGVDRDPPVGLGLGDAAGGLGRRVLDRRVLVGALDDVIGARARRRDVAVADPPAVMALVDEVVRAPVRDDRRVGLERLLDVEHRRQLLEIELDARDRLERGRLGLGDHRRDRLAAVADPLGGEHLLLVRLDADQAQDRVDVLRDVRRGQRADEARHLLGLREVDPLDPRVHERVADHLQMQHPGVADVVDVLGRPGHVAHAVAPRDPAADDMERLLRQGAHAAASAIASMIDW